MNKNKNTPAVVARTLTDDFLSRTGISNAAGDPAQRYLWTDSFAVQCCFALSNLLNSAAYQKKALKLIDQVHHTLGRHRPDDTRKGWISGLSETEGKIHPTTGGLRIGKKLPERTRDEPFNQRLEWERDGQYFHYLTRWFNALLLAQHETGKKTYGLWASELMEASRSFVHHDNGLYRMYWKMNIDLSEPVITSMGAHDPLEGLVSTISAMIAAPESRPLLEILEQEMKSICGGMDWFTTDALGIGGLLLNAAKTTELRARGVQLPACIRPEYLISEAVAGLRAYSMHVYDSLQPADMRLAFRECGLSLGIRVLYGLKDRNDSVEFDLNSLKEYTGLADEIEDFWSKPSNQLSPTWTEHLDINCISLASSLLARDYPQAFCPTSEI